MKIEFSDNLKNDFKFYSLLIATFILASLLGYFAINTETIIELKLNNDMLVSLLIVIILIIWYLLLGSNELLNYLKNNIKFKK